ncbi:MAG: hypothetical protein ACOX5T_00790 [Candidatus Cryptobacteroides sp.]|jgi:hypothetical protein
MRYWYRAFVAVGYELVIREYVEKGFVRRDDVYRKGLFAEGGVGGTCAVPGNGQPRRLDGGVQFVSAQKFQVVFHEKYFFVTE